MTSNICFGIATPAATLTTAATAQGEGTHEQCACGLGDVELAHEGLTILHGDDTFVEDLTMDRGDEAIRGRRNETERASAPTAEVM